MIKGPKLFLGDAKEALSELKDNSVDLVFTSPPYADSRKNTYGGIHPSNYVEWFLPFSFQLSKTDKGEYHKIAGQQFWEFISANKELYTEIIEPLGHRARERNEKFSNEYDKMINIFTQQFSKVFCIDGEINWKKIVQLNLGTEKIKVNI